MLAEILQEGRGKHSCEDTRLSQGVGRLRTVGTTWSTWRGQSFYRDSRQGQPELGRGLSKAPTSGILSVLISLGHSVEKSLLH